MQFGVCFCEMVVLWPLEKCVAFWVQDFALIHIDDRDLCASDAFLVENVSVLVEYGEVLQVARTKCTREKSAEYDDR